MPGGYIYKLTSHTSGKSYVGMTCKTPEQRFAKHVNKALNGDRDGCRYLNNAIRLYGPNDWDIEVLVHSIDCEIEHLKHKEVELIELHGTLSPGGYNLTRGGDGFTGGVMPESAKQTLSNVRRKHNIDEDPGIYVCNYVRKGFNGYVVKVPGKKRKTFINSKITRAENLVLAKAHRDRLMDPTIDSSECDAVENRELKPNFDIPKFVNYNSRTSSFAVLINDTVKYFSAKGKARRNLYNAMKYYIGIADHTTMKDDIAKAYFIINSLKDEYD